MANFDKDTPQFGSTRPPEAATAKSGLDKGALPSCAACEALLPDALDGTLTAEQQAEFDDHLASCTACTTMVADAQRGAAWLEMLRDPRPEPPAALLERILARTGAQTSALNLPADSIVHLDASATGIHLAPASHSRASAAHSRTLPFPVPGMPRKPRFQLQPLYRAVTHTLLQPRLAMTAAMAFFSVGLTLNLTGVQLNQLHANDLKPSSLRRGFYQANAHIVRYYDNLRVVYELESRVRELQRSSDTEPQPAEKSPENPPADAKPDKRPAPRPGSSRRQSELANPQSLAALHQSHDNALEGDLS